MGTFPEILEEELVNELNKIPIHHVYGSLGTLPWQDIGKVIAYGSKKDGRINLDFVNRASKN